VAQQAWEGIPRRRGGQVTAQELYDSTIKHLLVQGRQAKDHLGICLYRMEAADGTILKCAAGFHISDEDYHPAMEGCGILTLLGAKVSMRSVTILPNDHYLHEHRDLIAQLQILHDTDGNWHGKFIGFEAARRIASNFSFRLVPFDFEAWEATNGKA
jgi:hypothetical protein